MEMAGVVDLHAFHLPKPLVCFERKRGFDGKCTDVNGCRKCQIIEAVLGQELGTTLFDFVETF